MILPVAKYVCYYLFTLVSIVSIVYVIVAISNVLVNVTAFIFYHHPITQLPQLLFCTSLLGSVSIVIAVYVFIFISIFISIWHCSPCYYYYSYYSHYSHYYSHHHQTPSSQSYAPYQTSSPPVLSPADDSTTQHHYHYQYRYCCICLYR